MKTEIIKKTIIKHTLNVYAIQLFNYKIAMWSLIAFYLFLWENNIGFGPSPSSPIFPFFASLFSSFQSSRGTASQPTKIC